MASTRDFSAPQIQSYNVSFFSPPPVAIEGQEDRRTHYDFLLSFPQLLKLAESGNVSAQALVGCSLLYGWKGCLIDKVQGAKWIAKAKDRLDTPAGVFAQGVCYDEAICDVAIKDINKAADCFVQAGRDFYIPARSKLLSFFENGYGGLPKDINEMVRIATECANLGFAPAQNYLGFCYYEACGVPKDYKEMAKLFRASAEDGYAHARSKFGWCCENGYGVERSHAQARYWYKLAAEQGNEYARKGLTRVASCCVIL